MNRPSIFAMTLNLLDLLLDVDFPGWLPSELIELMEEESLIAEVGIWDSAF
jgi:hypothetical protein